MTDTRRMTCTNCGYIWRVRAGMPENQMVCPMCEVRVCACGCGADLSGLRSDAKFHSRACGARIRRTLHGSRPTVAAPELAAIQETAVAYMNTRVIADGEAYDYAIILQGDPCAYCSRRFQAKVRGAIQGLDHITPQSQGGDGSWMNLARVCPSCNSGKRDHSLLNYLRLRQLRSESEAAIA